MCPSSSHSTKEISSDPAPDTDSAVPSIVPSDAVSQAAYLHAAQHLHPLILAHSIRVYAHADHLASKESSPYASEDHLNVLLFVACIFHDIGTTDEYDTGPTRFEIEGADAAVNFLSSHSAGEQGEDWTEAEKHSVWVAIASHDTPQIAERIAPLARLVRLGVAIDFKRSPALSQDWVSEVEGKFPRGEIEKVLGDAVVEQALRRPEKAPAACWPGGLLRAKLEDPDWKGVNKAF